MDSTPICEIELIHPEDVREAQAALIDFQTASDLSATFEALADPNRVRLIAALLGQELCVCDLSAVLGMSQSAVSHQLRYLRSLRLVRPRKEGRVVYYSLDDDHIRDLFQRGLEHVRHSEKSEAL
jgi:ArsR family transcriptional regulator, lead/cadmium/zinc/bismuth-responsive transcriptional repressor